MKYAMHVVSTGTLQTGREAQVASENKFRNRMHAPDDSSFLKHQDTSVYYAEKSTPNNLAYVTNN